MTDRGLRLLRAGVANLAALAFGLGGAWLVHFALPWSILVAPLAGTLGWIVGAVAAVPLSRTLARHRTAAPGAPAYRLKLLPAEEHSAGGKARSLATMLQAGHPVPPGWVLLPRAFEGDRLTDEVSQWLMSEVRSRSAGRLLAVRSSALAEDSATASFAGAYESLLNVAADQLPSAIEQVRASRRAARVSAYAEATGAASTGELAVIVQEMVPAEQSGVLFTIHPLTHDLTTMVGNAVGGVAESLVSGSETGAEFTLSRPDGGFTGPDALRGFGRRLHDEAHRIEGTFGGVPQDIEWAVAGGRVWILQARPITTANTFIEATAERNDSLGGACLWSATNLSEANPKPQTPLTVSYMRFLQANGGPSMAIRGREMAGYIGGRPYANLSVQITARRGRNARMEPRQVYQKLAGWWGSLPDEVPVTVIPMTRDDWTDAGLGLLATLAKMVGFRRRLPAFLATNSDRCSQLSAQIADATTTDELSRLWRQVFEHGLTAFWMTIASGSELPAQVEAWLRERYEPELVAALLGSLSGLAGPLESLGPSVGLQEVRAGRMGREEYLRRFGHRGANEVELAWPRPLEDPSWLDRMLESAADGVDLAAAVERQRVAHAEAMARLAARDRAVARKVRRRLDRAACAASAREAARSEGVRMAAVMRQFALRAGDLLGLAEGDVFFLTVEELLDGLAGRRAAFGLIERRRAAHRRYQELPPLPGVIYGTFDPFAWAADPRRRQDYWVAGGAAVDGPPASGEVVRGFAGAAGVVEGVVRRLDDLDRSDELQLGEILVTHLTNIGWTPLFPRAAAVVTDLGAPLSHAAIVARELGIPAVVGCGDATVRLRDGDRVVVDGARGEVRIVSVRAEGAAEAVVQRS